MMAMADTEDYIVMDVIPNSSEVSCVEPFNMGGAS